MKRFINVAACLIILASAYQNKLYAQYDEQRFNLSGFAEMRYQRFDFDQEENNLVRDQLRYKDHFAVNNINLYMNFNVDANWLFFSEVRFLFSPNEMNTASSSDKSGDGNPDTVTSTPVDNTAYDNNSLMFKYGSIFIERAYIEWNKFQLAKLRFGKFFTPWGIWSQDHGAPVVTSIRVPILVETGWEQHGMPVSQTGIELAGKTPIPGNVILDYAAYVGNGKNDADETADQSDDNKSYGGFLNFKLPSIGIIDVNIGASGYRGERSFVAWRQGDILVINYTAVSMQYDNNLTRYYTKQMDTIGAAHLKIAVNELPFDGVFTIQAEAMRHHVKEDDDSRLIYMDQRTSKVPETYNVDCYYVQVEYEILGLVTPYFRYDSYQGDYKDPQYTMGFTKFVVYMAGINIKATPRIAIKLEWARGMFTTGDNLMVMNLTAGPPLYDLKPYDPNYDFTAYQASISAAF